MDNCISDKSFVEVDISLSMNDMIIYVIDIDIRLKSTNRKKSTP
jgi:hypothetical protein